MLRKFACFAVLAIAGAALVVPNPTFARSGGIGGFRGGMVRAPFALHRAPFMIRTGRPALVRPHAPSALPPTVARHFPIGTHVGTPFSHLVQRHHHGHHRRFETGWIYPFTTWDDGSYIGVPYDPGTSIPVYGPGPIIDSMIDPPPQWPAPRLSGIRYEGGEACHAERVTVPASEGEREITVVRC
jgi:hypothetical protein